MFEGFALQRIEVADGVTIRVRHGGNGPALVLLHGHPRTHTTWHRVAPALAQDFTVICPDLRGYGQSSKPETDAAHSPYSKRAMGDDIASLLSILGHEQFTIAGHDRGSYVALRLALDHPSRVHKLAVLDSVPIGEALNRADARFAGAWKRRRSSPSPCAHSLWAYATEPACDTRYRATPRTRRRGSSCRDAVRPCRDGAPRRRAPHPLNRPARC